MIFQTGFKETLRLTCCVFLFSLLMDFVFGNTPVTWFDVNAINGISSRSILQTWTNANRNGYEFTITDIFRSTSGFNSDMVFYQAE